MWRRCRATNRCSKASGKALWFRSDRFGVPLMNTNSSTGVSGEAVRQEHRPPQPMTGIQCMFPWRATGAAAKKICLIVGWTVLRLPASALLDNAAAPSLLTKKVNGKLWPLRCAEVESRNGCGASHGTATTRCRLRKSIWLQQQSRCFSTLLSLVEIMRSLVCRSAGGSPFSVARATWHKIFRQVRWRRALICPQGLSSVKHWRRKLAA